MTLHGERLRFEDRLTWDARECHSIWFRGLAVLLPLWLAGCGRIISTKATDQLIAGDAVDRSVAQVDFRLFAGKKVFLDTQYVNKTVPGVGFVTSEYIVSSLRQKMMCDGSLLQEKADEADFIIEMRIGALGADGHEIVFGMPPNNYASIAASVSPTSSPAAAILPSMPELSVAKKDDQMAAAKVALFAYNRHTREPIWQSGISESRSVVADRWFFGAGPFQKGNVYNPKKQTDSSLFSSDDAEAMKPDYFVERRFADPTKSLADTPPAAKTAVAAAPAAATPAVAAAQPAKAGATTPAATTPAVSSTTTPATTTPAAAAATTVAAGTGRQSAGAGSIGSHHDSRADRKHDGLCDTAGHRNSNGQRGAGCRGGSHNQCRAGDQRRSRGRQRWFAHGSEFGPDDSERCADGAQDRTGNDLHSERTTG